MASTIKAVALKACRHFMVPIARFMLGVGIGYREFAEISKLAFVQVASDEHGIRGRKTNMSRVSVMTGLNRKEIRKLRDRLKTEDWELDSEASKPSAVLTKWFTDPRYLGPKGSPKWLPFDSTSGLAFCNLVREVGGDVPPGAMLRELRRAGCIKEVRPNVWRAVKRQYSPAGVDVFQVQRFGECLHDLADTITTNYFTKQYSPEKLFEFRALSDDIDPKVLPELRRIVSTQGEAYLESIDNWFGAQLNAKESGRDSESARCGVGIYYFESRRHLESAKV